MGVFPHGIRWQQVENLGNLKSNAPMDEDKSVNGTGAACQGRMARGSDSVEEPSNLTFGAEQLISPAEGVDGTGVNSQGGMPCGSVSALTTQDLVENLIRKKNGCNIAQYSFDSYSSTFATPPLYSTP